MKSIVYFAFLYLLTGVVGAQQSDYVDFKHVKVDVFSIGSDLNEIAGDAFFTFEILKDIDSVYLDAKNITHREIALNGSLMQHDYDGNLIVVKNDFKANTIHELHVSWMVADPKKAIYSIDDQIWTQGQGKYTSHWLPSIDDVNDKIEFDLNITYDSDYVVVANGQLVNKTFKNGSTKWQYDMVKPMSSYLVAMAIGNYSKTTESSNSGVSLEYYYYPEDSLKVEPTYRYTKQMFDYLEQEIGVSYPWQNYKQVPVKDFLYSGMENTSLTIFSDSFVVDSIAYNDKNYVTVNAHEMAHQWFGDLVTAKSGEHHWLQEGFATYYALLAERHVFGEDHYYWQLFENAQELIAQETQGKSTSLLNPKSSSTTFYKKGAWALHILREKVGDSAFKVAVKRYLEKFQYSNVDTSNFIMEVETASEQDLTGFVDEWLIESKFPEGAVVTSLKQSGFMREYLSFDCDDEVAQCEEALYSDISDRLKVKIISRIPEHVDVGVFENSLEVRRAIANYLTRIPASIKNSYESLLDDRSYITIESALYNLWLNFPEERAKYLNKTSDVIGFKDHNVRLLWLVLHLNTPEYQSKQKIDVLNELISYSLPHQHFELRMNAFNYLKLIRGFEIESIKSLMQATGHHNWRFSNFAKTMLAELENDSNYKLLIGKLKNQS